MTDDPTVTADIIRIQDVYLTRASMLLAREAGIREWHFVVDTARTSSGDAWDVQDSFLFDYTLGRLICTLRDTGSSESGTFVDYFTLAIRSGASRSARTMWAAERTVRRGDRDALTVMLIAALPLHLGEIERARLMRSLPEPCRP